MGFNSFFNEQFNTRFYVTTAIQQPDTGTSGHLSLCEQPIPCISLRDFFRSEIDNAIATGTPWQSDIMNIAKVTITQPGHATYYYNVQVIYTGSQLQVKLDTTGSSPSSFGPSVRAYNKLDTAVLNIYLIKEYTRSSFAAAGSPNWDGERLFLCLGQPEIDGGYWNEPSVAFPYGYMEYDFSHYDFAYNCLYYRATACNEDDSSRASQPHEILYFTACTYEGSTGYKDMIAMGVDGNYDTDDPGPADPFPPSDPDPYRPTPQDTSDLISLPADPPLGITSAGFINVYKTGINALQGLGDILFPNPLTATDVLDAITKLYETIANQNLINYIIDCHIIPVSPTVGAGKNIKVGYRDTGIAAPDVVSDYVNVSCGSLNIQEFYGGFQDYQCTRSKLFLPMLGFVDVLPEFWQSGTISVDYKFNIIDGSFMVYVRSVSSKSNLNGSVIAQYGGNACIHLPLTGVNYSNMVSGLIEAAAGVVSAGGGASAVMGGAASAANTFAQGGNIQQSNGYNSTTSMLGVRTPFLQIERLVPAWSSNYRHDKGLPSNIATALSNVRGYTEIEDIELSGIPFTDTEIEELRGILKEGVYF